MHNNLGQYFEGESFLHKLDVRLKIIICFGFIAAAFVAQSLYGIGVLLLLCLGLFGQSGIPLKKLYKKLRFLIPMGIIVVLLQGAMKGGSPVVVIWGLQFGIPGLQQGVMSMAKLCLLLVSSFLLSMTTLPTQLSCGIYFFTRPLEKIGVPVGLFAALIGTSLRFIPTFFYEADLIRRAQWARGARIDRGSLAKRLKVLCSWMVPVLAVSIQRAHDTAIAMETRCFDPRAAGVANFGYGKLEIKNTLAAVLIIVVQTAACFI